MREPTNCAGISQRVVDCSSCSSINTATNLVMEDGADQNDSFKVTQRVILIVKTVSLELPPRKRDPEQCAVQLFTELSTTVTGNPISHLYHVGSMIKLIVFIAKYATRM